MVGGHALGGEMLNPALVSPRRDDEGSFWTKSRIPGCNNCDYATAELQTKTWRAKMKFSVTVILNLAVVNKRGSISVLRRKAIAEVNN